MDDLEQKLKPVGAKERQILLAMKKEEHAKLGLPFDGEFYIWDYRYYDRKYIEESLDLDDLLVKEYFPVSVVVPTILEIYQKLLGVRFVEHHGETWHPGILFVHHQRIFIQMRPQRSSNSLYGTIMPKTIRGS